jgi:hypothetical protein
VSLRPFRLKARFAPAAKEMAALGRMFPSPSLSRPCHRKVLRRLLADGRADALVQSFANGAATDDHNLILWRWDLTLPHKAKVYDPTGKLPKNQLSGR